MSVGTSVGTGVLVSGIGVSVGTGVGVSVGAYVGVGVSVGTSVGVLVGSGVGVLVGTSVGVGVAVGWLLFVILKYTNSLYVNALTGELCTKYNVAPAISK